MSTFIHAGVRLEYHEAGHGGAFLFQHGLGGDHRQTLSLVPARDACRAITLNCRAHGQSQLGDPRLLSFDTLAADALALLQELGVKRAVLGGISMGAALALACAHAASGRIAVDGLVLIRPAWGEHAMSEPARAACGEIAGLLRRYPPEQAAERFRRSALFRDIHEQGPGAAESLLEYCHATRVRELVEVYARLPSQAPVADRASWSSFPAPVLVIGAPGDAVHPLGLARRIAERSQGTFAEVTAKSLDPACHQREVERLVLDFVRRHSVG